MGDDGYNLGDLNRTMAKKMADKYDHGLEKSVREWMAVKLPERAGEIKNEGTSFHELLKTFVVFFFCFFFVFFSFFFVFFFFFFLFLSFISFVFLK